MAISRMQQPRQMYGLGSFVKKLTRKVTRPITKVASKIVPKEIAGIMRLAAPFLGPVAGPAAYLLGTAKQTGRISPIDLALTLAPTVGKMTLPGEGRLAKLIPDNLEDLTVSEAIGNIPLPFTKKDLGDVLVGRKKYGTFEGPRTKFDTIDFRQSPGYVEKFGETTGIFGKGGEMFQLGKGDVGILDTKVGQTLFGKPEMVNDKATGNFVPSFLKIGSTGVSLASLIKDAKTPEEAGNALVEATGNSDDYEAGVQMFSTLPQGIFDIPQQFRLNSANGGLMRTNYANGTKKFNDKYLAPEYEDDFKKFLQELREQNKEMDLNNIMEMFKQKMRKQDPILEAKDGGLMRTNYAIGSDDKGPVLPSDEDPINPFGPKPEGPVLPNKKMASDNMNDKLLESLYEEFLEEGFSPEDAIKKAKERFDLMSKADDDKGIMMAGMDRKDRAMELADMLAQEEFGQDFYDLDIRTQMKIYQIALDMIDSGGNAMGGTPNNRMDLALGTKPTTEESGLGGLPIEADMRYTGGFMPYGAKEKADDVPARLSKNEFVFTADAVRAAGGGSVNEGAKKMYTAMKQLEKKPEAKGMMA